MRSPLLAVALRSDQPKISDQVVVADLLRYLLETIQRLASNVQFAEFTEHGLPHIVSLLNRISAWTVRGQDGETTKQLIGQFSPKEALLLSFAVLTHDLGMLSQRAEDLPPERRFSLAPQYADLQGWVRSTHVDRLKGLVHYVLEQHHVLQALRSEPLVDMAILLAMSHHEWPDSTSPIIFEKLRQCASQSGIEFARITGLAAVLGVADLLDEDWTRCDAEALLGHKSATTLNRSHWLRHRMIQERLEVRQSEVVAHIGELTRWRGNCPAALAALRLHLQDAERYNAALEVFNASIEMKVEETVLEDDLHGAPLDYFDLTPDVHLLRAFDQQLERLVSVNCVMEQDQVSEKRNVIASHALFVRDLLPTDYDAIITLRAAKRFWATAETVNAAQAIARRDMLMARDQGKIMLAMKLKYDYNNEL